jgi:TPR repeat protein
MTDAPYDFEILMQRGEWDKAFEAAMQHAMSGNSDAQCQIAFLLEVGLGVQRNGAEAELWYRKAADQGNPVAWNNLGTFYATQGDRQRARECYLRAKELGFNCAHPYPPPFLDDDSAP